MTTTKKIQNHQKTVLFLQNKIYKGEFKNYKSILQKEYQKTNSLKKLLKTIN